MKNKSILSSGILFVIMLCVCSAFSQESTHSVQNPHEYFNNRTKAITLARNGNWQQLIPITESLTQQYQKDGDLFYLLGLAYYETEQYQKALTALKNTLKLGGTVLNNIPKGSAPSNDIIIKIAKAYALDGDKLNAIIWLQKGFEARYDEKPFLKGDDAFKNFNNDKDFLALFGEVSQKDISREEAWIKDVSYLEKRINELHYSPYHLVSKTELAKAFQILKTSIATLSDKQIVVALMKLVGSLGNGHNLMIPTSPNIGALKKLPVQFYQFNDGLFIVDAEEGLEKWIGYKVDFIGNTSAVVAIEKTNAVNAKDNDMQTLWLGPYYAGLPDVLEGIGVIEDAKNLTLTLSDSKRNTRKVSLNPVDWNFAGFPLLPKLKKENQPLFLSKTEDFYWSIVLPEYHTMFVQFNLVQQKEDLSFMDFNLKLREDIKTNNTQNLILDLRFNSGGNGAILPPILKTLMLFESLRPEGKIFVLMGRGTFSAAQNLLTEITKYTNAILVGEPSGSKPNHIGEAGWFKLPYSGLMGLISTQFHQTSKAEDGRNWIAPHIPVSVSSTDYFNGNDKALNVIIDIIKSDKN